jgi:hypothetical protein
MFIFDLINHNINSPELSFQTELYAPVNFTRSSLLFLVAQCRIYLAARTFSLRDLSLSLSNYNCINIDLFFYVFRDGFKNSVFGYSKV